MGGDISKQTINSTINSISEIVNENLSRSVKDIASISQNVQNIRLIVDNCKIKNLTLEQLTEVNAQMVTEINEMDCSAISTKLQREAKNSGELVKKVLKEMGADLGSVNVDETVMNITTNIQEVVKNKVVKENMDKVIQSVCNLQGADLILRNCEMGDVNVSQKIIVKMVAKTIANSVMNSIIDNESIQRMANDAKAQITVEKKGLAQFVAAFGEAFSKVVSAFTKPMTIVIIAIIIGLVIGGALFLKFFQLKQLFNFKVIIAIVIGIILIITVIAVVSYVKSSGVKLKYGCEFDSKGMATGKCVELTEGDVNAIAATKEQCEKYIKDKKACFQYWGCEKGQDGKSTGNCKQFKTANGGIYYDKEDCEDSFKCTSVYGCKFDPDTGFYTEDAQTSDCVKYTPEDKKPKRTYVQLKDCSENRTLCQQNWKIIGSSSEDSVCEQQAICEENTFATEKQCEDFRKTWDGKSKTKRACPKNK